MVAVEEDGDGAVDGVVREEEVALVGQVLHGHLVGHTLEREGYLHALCERAAERRDELHRRRRVMRWLSRRRRHLVASLTRSLELLIGHPDLLVRITSPAAKRRCFVGMRAAAAKSGVGGELGRRGRERQGSDLVEAAKTKARQKDDDAVFNYMGIDPTVT